MPDHNTTSTSSRQPGTAAGTREQVMQRYRAQEARLTRRMRLATVVAVAAAAFIVYAVHAGGASPSAVSAAAAGTLTCLGTALQARASRDRVRRLLQSGAAGQIARRLAEAEDDPRPDAAPPQFYQQYCKVSRQFAGGRLQAGQAPPAYLVVVQGSLLTVVEAPGTPVLEVPAVNTQIATPTLQLRFGTVTTLRIGEAFWGFDFTGVYLAEQHAGLLRQVFSAGSPRKSARRARELNGRFTAALLAAGARQ